MNAEPLRDGAKEGDVIADRYTLVAPLGAGSFGEVWRAEDRITKGRVAVKLLFSHVALGPARAQLEVAALRQRLPGVVELKDDGVHEGRAFLVTELVEGGLPFPGKPGKVVWEDIAGVTVSLLETIARVHGAFLVHRDLKPENVLVTPAHEVRVLDFGVAYRHTLDSVDTGLDGSYLVGTLPYIAPEQVQSQSLTDQTDLYAVGVMLYHALSGRFPHEGDDAGRVLYHKVRTKPPPLLDVAPGAPPAVARLVDAMLEIHPEMRPKSAFDVLAGLRGERSVEAHVFPWIGPLDTIHAVIAAAREGRSVDIVGPRGSGRTRHLLAAEQTLAPERRVFWIPAGDRAFASLSPLLDGTSGPRPATLEEAEIRAERALDAAFAGGAVLLVDEPSRVDPRTRSLFARRDPSSGAILRALEAPSGEGALTVRLAPLAESALKNLFAGPDRLLHLREDAARILYQRTFGVPSRVERELSSWMSLGIARWVRNLIAVSRDALDRLALDWLAGAPADADAALLRGISQEEADILVWATLASPHTTARFLADLTGDSPLHTASITAALLDRGLLARLGDTHFSPVVPPPIASWSEERVRAAHRAIVGALSPGQRNRLSHLVAAGTTTDEERRAAASEAAAQAARLIDEGHLGEAVAAIETGLRATRALGPEARDQSYQLLALWLEAAFDDGTPHALDRARYAICRAAPRTPQIDQLERLSRAVAAEDVRGRALAILGDIPPFDDLRLERVRLDVFAAAARKLADERMEARLLHELRRSPAADDPEIAARLDHWRARVLYLKGDYREAARLHAAAARRSLSVPLRITAMTSGAYSLLEDYRLDEARALAEEARRLAAEHRHASQEAIAEWTLRTIAYRSGDATSPDNELVQAVPYAAGRQFQGAVMSTEAAVAWRKGRARDARALARRGHETLAEIGAKRGTLLLSAFRVALGDDVTPEEVRDILKGALASTVPGIGIQALALLAMGDKLPPGAAHEAEIQRLAALVPREHWSARCDILSIDECLSALSAPSNESG